MIVKRDLELLRRLLLAIEESDDIPVHPNQLTNLCSDQNLLNYHIYLLYEAGFIHAIEVDVMGSYILNIAFFIFLIPVTIILIQ